MCKKFTAFPRQPSRHLSRILRVARLKLIRQIDGIYCRGIYIWRGERNERLTENGDFDHIHATSNLLFAATKCAWSFSGC